MNTPLWIASLSLSLAAAAPAQLIEGDRAPAIEISEPLETGIKNWSDLKGKVLLLHFFGFL